LQNIITFRLAGAAALAAVNFGFACTVAMAAGAERLDSAQQTEAALAQTRIEIGDDPHGRNVQYEIVDGLAIVEGDIVIGEADNLPTPDENGKNFAQGRGIAVTQIGSLWPNAVVPYQISPTLASTTTENKIGEAIDHIQSRTPVSFVLRTPSNAAQYPDYVEFAPGSGCASYVG